MNAITARKSTDEVNKKKEVIKMAEFETIMSVVYADIKQNIELGKYEAIIPLRDMGGYSVEVIARLRKEFYFVIAGNDGILVEW